ncbi:MAG TPA: Rpn family recombination-promoting nuclease/putative transposase [Aquella sp.]|nr:Rpn family recombination-promoting nuclease/putative transposase [Aquella sp.]
MKKLQKKHDKIAKLFLADPEIAHKFLSLYLPHEILIKCNLSKINVEPGTYIDEELQSQYSDIVYKIGLTDMPEIDSIYLYVLIEHQSKADKLMPLRIIRYQLEIIQKHLDKYKGNELKLPLVVPLVLYNGKKSPYPYPCDIRELFADKELAAQVLLGKFKLIDLTVSSDDEILNHGKLSILEIVTKHIHDRDFIKAVDLIIEALVIVHDENINESLINGVFNYIGYAKEKKETIYFLKQVSQKTPFYERNAMSYAEELIQEGYQKGKQETMSYAEELIQEGYQKCKQESIQQTQQQIVKNMINSGLPPEQVAKYVGISLEKIEHLHKINK